MSVARSSPVTCAHEAAPSKSGSEPSTSSSASTFSGASPSMTITCSSPGRFWRASRITGRKACSTIATRAPESVMRNSISLAG